MLLVRERGEVAHYAERLVADGLAVATAGNLSARAGTLVAITPAGIGCDLVAPGDVVVVDLAGDRVDGDLTPSSELPMHLAIYAATGARAVVHTHSPYATALATAGMELPPIHYLAAELGGTVRLASYATFGSEELAERVVEALAGRTAALLERHGTVTTGSDVAEAYQRAATLEWLAALYLRASAITRVRPLPEDELVRVRERLAARRAALRA
jgi:L-fuculose-phosphate aldolase